MGNQVVTLLKLLVRSPLWSRLVNVELLIILHQLNHHLPFIQSKNCRLYGLSPKELVKHHEEVQEWGGYFIVNGNEKIIRMLIMPRRNYVR